MNKHLKEINMTYWEHFWFALRLALEGICMISILIIHAIIPCTFTNYFSKWIQSCHGRIKR